MNFQRRNRFVGILSAAALCTGTLLAQGNYRDKMKVDFSHPVHVQGYTLPAGSYTIQTMSGRQSNNNVLMVYGKDNMNFKTSFTTIDAQKLGGAKTTHVTLRKVGSDYFLSKLFIAGKIYGYAVPLPDNIKDQADSGDGEDVAGQLEDGSQDTK